MLSLYIITGASSGLGACIAKEISSDEVHLILIGRNNKNLMKVKSQCELNGSKVNTYSIDLSSNSYYEKFKNILSELNLENYSKCTLINNAGTILPIVHLDNAKYEDVYNLFNLNLVSAICLSQLFMKSCKNYAIKDSLIFNVSSGASLNAIEGWGLYCMSKSAINMLTNVIINDTKNWENPVKSVSINPGPLDTNMQNEIRKSDEKQGPLKNKFVKMYNSGELFSPAIVAKRIKEIINSDLFPNGEYIDFTSK
tara:strand:+ start:25 stop:786 length:762 start_codon:yes stop_codon:yes gene_type:complete